MMRVCIWVRVGLYWLLSAFFDHYIQWSGSWANIRFQPLCSHTVCHKGDLAETEVNHKTKDTRQTAPKRVGIGRFGEAHQQPTATA